MRRLWEVAAKKLRGEYDAIADQAITLVKRVEDLYGFDTGVRRVIVWPSQGGWYLYKSFPLIGGTIKVPDFAPRSQQLRDYVYHEMGHAIHDHYELKGRLASFTRRCQRSWGEYQLASDRARDYERLSGFVSGYARCNREEDFCETLSAYLSNRKSWRSCVVYEGERIYPRRESRLMEKLEAVHELLRILQDFQ